MGKEVADVTMGEADAAKPAEEQHQQTAAPAPPRALAVLRSGVALIRKAVEQKETRTLFGRLLRQTAAVRRQLTAADLAAFLAGALPPGSSAAERLQQAVTQVSTCWEVSLDAGRADEGWDGSGPGRGKQHRHARVSCPPCPHSLGATTCVL